MPPLDYSIVPIKTTDFPETTSMSEVKEFLVNTTTEKSKVIPKENVRFPASQITEIDATIQAVTDLKEATETAAGEAAQSATDAEAAQGLTEGFKNQAEAFKNAAAAIVSGGPRGVYATLSALIAANPDHTYTYVVTADGNWYYWNGSTFVSGGVYQTVADYELKSNKKIIITDSDMEYPTSKSVNKAISDSTSDSATLNITFLQKDNLLPIDGIIAQNNDFKLYYIPVKLGDKFKVNFTYSSNDGAYYGYTAVEPYLNTVATNCYAKIFSQFVDTEVTALVDGYFVVGLEFANITSDVTFIKANTGIGTRVLAIENKLKQVIIGAGGDFETVKDGFEYAHVNNIDEVVILPGTYDLVDEGIEDYSFYKYNYPSYKAGFFAPKRIYGYGATLVCRLPTPNWEISPINIFYGSDGIEIYGLEIRCANCRYCIHDEMWDMASWGSAYYHNIFKDLVLVHESAPTEILIRPMNIGGGFGDHGDVLIENCRMSSESDANCDYHSKASGVQVLPCTVTVKDCVLNKTISATNSGTSTAYVNKAYVNNNLCGSLPVKALNYNMELIPWNNVINI